ncbi:Peptidase family M48 [Streptomyces sp. yr375]|uniref:M48 family metalloprotease n=1 Tax=Streptomyces sp. yr375 TaxID=1761906 RepID=UPI0008ADC49A|nr:M48 family metalloprotease [Streptomyces sp. yr375]SEQ18760.1 Peptidase family M48 [Streptomyces sp. yr375]
MTGAPGAATPAADHHARREAARTLMSSPLPLPTTTRLVLLVLVAGAGASFAAWWWLILGRDNWPDAQLACLPAAEASPDAVLDRFTGCVYDVRLAQAAVVLCGPLALLALALVCRAAGRRLSLWLWAATPDHSSLSERLTAVLPEPSEASEPSEPSEQSDPSEQGVVRPKLWVRQRRVGVLARASGSVRDPWIVADSNVFNLPDRQVEAKFRHELAHLRLRDVGRVRLAVAAWWLLLTAVVLPVAAALVRDPGLLGPGLLVRMTLVLVIVLLTLRAVLRIREHDADLGAEADPRAPCGATADHIGSGLPPNRWQRILRAAGLASHPTTETRLAILSNPARSWGLPAAECLTTGLAAGLLFTDLALLIGALMPTRVQLAYAVAGLLTGWAVAGVVTVGWWRAVAVEHRDASGRHPPLAGAALGLGVLAGSQLSGRAAGDWIRDTGTADGLATALSLTHTPRPQVLGLALALVIGGALYATWTTSLARAVRATVTGPRSAPACAAAVVLSGLLIAVPLGSWFLFARLTAARATSDIRWGVIDTPWWATGVAVSVCGALLPFAMSAGRRTGSRAKGPVAVLVAAGVVVAAGAGWATVGDRFSDPPTTVTVRPSTSNSPDPSATSHPGDDETVPIGELPVLPPEQERTARLRADTALVCRALALGGTGIWTDPQRRRDTAELLGGLDDTVLRAASAVLLRDPNGPVDRDALVASAIRCDLYFRYHR